ncbi:MAG TPA: MarR family transcriptional regulator [Bacillales bacterium]|nr:MarR family transcriptional regulator [Bacillales bacterium]
MNTIQKVGESELSLKCLVVLLRANHAVMDFDRKDIKRYGLFPTEFGVLELLFHKGEQPIQQIGKRILLTSGSITYVIDKLEEKGLIERKRCLEDRRVVNAAITEKGKSLMREIFPKHQTAVKKIFSGLTSEEKQDFILLLKKLGLSLQQ